MYYIMYHILLLFLSGIRRFQYCIGFLYDLWIVSVFNAFDGIYPPKTIHVSLSSSFTHKYIHSGSCDYRPNQYFHYPNHHYLNP